MSRDADRVGRYLCLVLRHKPEAAGIALDAHGWADVDGLVAGVSRKYPLDRASLEEIVRTDAKGRYSFSPDGSRIRANQGHSVPVDVEPERLDPPDVLYHGTGRKYVASIDAQGLLPKSRLHVHLSADVRTALSVGARHGDPVVYEVDAKAMGKDGIPFWRSANGVWLVGAVPPHYLSKKDINNIKNPY